LAIVCLFIHERPKAMPLSRILAICLVTLMGMAVVKFLPLAVIVLSAALASFWLEFGKDSKKLGRLGEALTALKKLYEDTLVGHGLAVFLIAALFIQIVRIDSHRTSAQQTPKEAVDYIINNNLPGPILNIFGDGGYLMYRYSDELGEPKLLVPIDGRTNVNDREVMRKHEKAIAGKLGWREYIEAVNPNVILWRTEGPLTAILLEKPEWKLVHQDGTDDSGHVVFVKTKLAR